MIVPSTRHLVLASSIGLALISRATGLTYWIDQTCDNQLLGVEDDYKKMASRSIERIKNSKDTNQEDVLKRLFMKPSSDKATLDEVIRVEDGIGAFTKTDDRAASDVRIYCDDDSFGNGGRWQPVPDIKKRKKDVPLNSQRTRGEDQEFYDPINGIRMTNLGDMGCKDLEDDQQYTAAETFMTLSKDTKYSGENPKRSSITICKIITDGKIKSFGDLPTEKDISKLKNLDAFDSMASLVMLHEFTHTTEYMKVDHNYMWDNIQKLDAQKALENADSFAYFGLLAKLADRKFILSKDSAKATSGELDNDANYIQKRRRRRSLGGLSNERLHPRALVELVGKMG